MPLLLSKQIHNNAAYAVWHIQESFSDLPYLSPDSFPTKLHPIKQAEWIVGRILIKQLCETFDLDYHGVEKYDTGKPFLKGHKVEISISHSFPMVAAMLHLKRSCGIDIEQPREKIQAVQNKFLNSTEKKYQDNLKKICAVWCAKEVVYKIYGRRHLSLKDDIEIQILNDKVMHGKIIRPSDQEKFEIRYEWVKDYLLAYST